MSSGEPHLAVSIVIPAYNEADSIQPCVRRIASTVKSRHEIVIVVDQPSDSTIPAVESLMSEIEQIRIVVQNSMGPAQAIRHGFSVAEASVVVITMADGSDDPACIDDMVRLVDRGCVIAAASRYMPGGQQIGGPRLKALMSRGAGKSLRWFAGVTTSDATNSFKAYDRAFVEEVGITSDSGFEIGIELVAKARRLRRPIAEVPTIWLDRDAGESRFQLKAWIPKYLQWYRLAYGRELSVGELRDITTKKELK